VNGAWSFEVVEAAASGYNRGSQNSLDLDASGNPRVAYVTGSQQLKFASRSASGWSIESVPYSSASRPSLQMNGNTPLISIGNAGVSFAHRESSGWRMENVDQRASDSFAATSLALGANGDLAMAYFSSDYDDGIRYAKWNGVGWDIERVSLGGSSPSLELTPAGVPYIAYWSGKDLKVATVVPEPGSALLLTAGTGMLALRRRGAR
jgi:hypothetical protein